MPESKQTLYARITVTAQDRAHAERMVQGTLARYHAVVEFVYPKADPGAGAETGMDDAPQG